MKTDQEWTICKVSPRKVIEHGSRQWKRDRTIHYSLDEFEAGDKCQFTLKLFTNSFLYYLNI